MDADAVEGGRVYDWNYAELSATFDEQVNQQHGHDALRFAYLDSGPPIFSGTTHEEITRNCTTIVCIHGHTYTARTFERALNAISKDALSLSRQTSRVRLIAMNRRDYAPTTPLTSAELAQLFSTPSGSDSGLHQHQQIETGTESTHVTMSSTEAETSSAQNHFLYLRARAVELARVLVWFCQHTCGMDSTDPTANNQEDFKQGSDGKLAVLGWSLGTAYVLALLAFLRETPSGSPDGLKKEEDKLRRILKRRMSRAFLLGMS